MQKSNNNPISTSKIKFYCRTILFLLLDVSLNVKDKDAIINPQLNPRAQQSVLSTINSQSVNPQLISDGENVKEIFNPQHNSNTQPNDYKKSDSQDLNHQSHLNSHLDPNSNHKPDPDSNSHLDQKAQSDSNPYQNPNSDSNSNVKQKSNSSLNINLQSDSLNKDQIHLENEEKKLVLNLEILIKTIDNIKEN